MTGSKARLNLPPLIALPSLQSKNSQNSVMNPRLAARSGSMISRFVRYADFLDKAIAAGLLAALLFSTLAHGAVEPWSVALFELILLLLLLLWGIKAVLEQHLRMIIPTAALPMLALLLLAIVESVAFTSSNGKRVSLSMDVEATRHVATVLFFLAIAFIGAANFLVTRERLFILAKVLTIFGAVLAGFALMQHLTWNGRIYWLRLTAYKAFGPFVNRHCFAGYMAMLVPLPLGLIVRVVRGQTRLLYGFAAALMGTAVFVSDSRSGVISLAGSMVFMMMLNRRSSPVNQMNDPARHGVWRLLRIGPITVVALAMIASAIWMGASGIVEHFGDAVDQQLTFGAPDVGRAMIWRDTLDMIRHHPVLGVGLGAYETIYPTYQTMSASFRVNYAHNDYLQVLADTGIVGGAIAGCFIVVVFLAIYRGVRSRNPLCAAMALAAGTGIVAVLIQSISDTDLQIPSNALLFLILCAVVANTGETNETAAGASSHRIRLA
jgi:O-antigen ligase